MEYRGYPAYNILSEMTYPIAQQIAAVKQVAAEKRGAGEVALADALQAALQSLVARSATAGSVGPASGLPVVAQVPRTLYKQFEAEYHAFCREHTGMDGRMDGAQGKALNSIIEYLTANNRTRDAAGALKSWQYLLSHWDQVGDFLARQKQLTAINKYLVELLETIRKANNVDHKKPLDSGKERKRKRLLSEMEDAARSVQHFQTCAEYPGRAAHRHGAEAALEELRIQLNAL